MTHHCWRDCSAWLKDEHIRMSTTSNEACKLYDSALSQYVMWRELDNGLEQTLNDMINADPEFLLGHVLKTGLNLIGSSLVPSRTEIELLERLKSKNQINLTKHELCHYEAIRNLYNGNLQGACARWEEILIEHPNDLMALKFAHDIYFYLGKHAQMRDSVARVMPFWTKNKSRPLNNYLYGMHSFGLVQSNYFEEARQAALTSLSMNREDAWATHTLCHYNEYKVRAEEGIKFLSETEADWSKCNLLASHNYWHLCLHFIEIDQHEHCLEIFDSKLLECLSYNRTLDLVDLVSLLYRLKLDCCRTELSERWQLLNEAYESRISDHGYLFNDLHVAILLSSTESERKIDTFWESFYSFTKSNNDEEMNQRDNNHNIFKSENYLKLINNEFGEKVFNCIFEFEMGNYERVVDILHPIRYDLIRIGGSNAQRDLFSQILLQSAFRSKLDCHKKLGLALLNERQAMKPNSRLTERIKARFTSKHILD